MAYPSAHKKRTIAIGLLIIGIICLISLRPVAPGSSQVIIFRILPGDSFWQILLNLHSAGLVRSSVVSGGLAVVRGQIRSLKAGEYELSPGFSGLEILDALETGARREVTVTIPEGASIFEVDSILAQSGIIEERSLLPFQAELEGYLFPDTYRFFMTSSSSLVLDKFKENFVTKTNDLLPKDSVAAGRAIIIASLIEKEVLTLEDGRIVAGILEKRIRQGMPLQVDATLCYVKILSAAKEGKPFEPCREVVASDKELVSPYNTYKNKGLPPGPINSPGLWAIEAALSSQASPYWFYISDPETKATIFARTLEEHNKNIGRYLR